jgi:hypothetical protein
VTIEQLRAVYNAQPFDLFVIHLADGRQIPVKSREFLASSPAGRTLVIYEAEDKMHIVDVLMITELEITKRNGQRRERRKQGRDQ